MMKPLITTRHQAVSSIGAGLSILWIFVPYERYTKKTSDVNCVCQCSCHDRILIKTLVD